MSWSDCDLAWHTAVSFTRTPGFLLQVSSRQCSAGSELHTCSKYTQRLYVSLQGYIGVSLQISLRTRFVNKFVLAYCYTKS